MISVIFVPVIKNKSRRINDSDNYRPIALASIVSKVVEKVILNRISEFFLTTCNQFGFKNKLGTDMCIYALKEILENHRSHSGSMFMGFLDASKAFDRLKHTTLFRKLIDRRVPNYVVRIMMYWSSSFSSLGSRCVPWLGEGLSMSSPNDPVLCCPLPYRVARVFAQVVSPPLGWSPLSSFLVIMVSK